MVYLQEPAEMGDWLWSEHVNTVAAVSREFSCMKRMSRYLILYRRTNLPLFIIQAFYTQVLTKIMIKVKVKRRKFRYELTSKWHDPPQPKEKVVEECQVSVGRYHTGCWWGWSENKGYLNYYQAKPEQRDTEIQNMICRSTDHEFLTEGCICCWYSVSPSLSNTKHYI